MGLGLRLRVAFVAVFMAVAAALPTMSDRSTRCGLPASADSAYRASSAAWNCRVAGTGLDRGHRRLYVGIDFERLAAGVDQEVDLVDRQPEPGGDLVQLRLGWRVEVGEGKVLDYKADTRGRRRS